MVSGMAGTGVPFVRQLAWANKARTNPELQLSSTTTYGPRCALLLPRNLFAGWTYLSYFEGPISNVIVLVYFWFMAFQWRLVEQSGIFSSALKAAV
jgi:hypothetical protein